MKVLILCQALLALNIYQFPRTEIPRIDGEFSDWDQVPAQYVICTDMLKDDSGKYSAPNPQTLDVKVKVGWVKGLNRLYFYYEAKDNYWDFSKHSLTNDILEIVVDGDLSGGPHVAPLRPNPEKTGQGEYFFTTQNCHAQNYHIMTPSEPWKSWAMVWGPQQWLKEFPYSNCASNYDFKPGESGTLRMEFYITVYDHADPQGPEKSKETKLEEGNQIGLSWAIIDQDGGPTKDGFWNLSDNHKMYGNADYLRRFTLCPLENQKSCPIQAAFNIKVAQGSRTASFTDESTGEITSWLWEFGDGATSTEKNRLNAKHPWINFTRSA